MSSKIVIKDCHETRFSIVSIVIRVSNITSHQKMSSQLWSKIVIKNVHQKLPSKIVITNCHQCLKGHRSLGSLFNVKNQKVGHSVSESVSDKVTYWAVRWQLKTLKWGWDLHISVENLISVTQSRRIKIHSTICFRSSAKKEQWHPGMSEHRYQFCPISVLMWYNIAAVMCDI